MCRTPVVREDWQGILARSPEARVEDVAEGVAEEVRAHSGESEGDAGAEHDPRESDKVFELRQLTPGWSRLRKKFLQLRQKIVRIEWF